MSRFEELRAHLSHSLLRNGVLARLGITSDFFRAEDETREHMLTNVILGIDRISENHRQAVKAWRGSAGYEPGVRPAIAELLDEASKFRTRRPSAQFPSSDEVGRWLDDMEDFLSRLETFPKLSARERQNSAESFARGAINLLDLLRDLDVDSENFWKYFERSRRQS